MFRKGDAFIVAVATLLCALVVGIFMEAKNDTKRQALGVPPPSDRRVGHLQVEDLRIIIREECERAIRNAQLLEKK